MNCLPARPKVAGIEILNTRIVGYQQTQDRIEIVPPKVTLHNRF